MQIDNSCYQLSTERIQGCLCCFISQMLHFHKNIKGTSQLVYFTGSRVGLQQHQLYKSKKLYQRKINAASYLVSFAQGFACGRVKPQQATHQGT